MTNNINGCEGTIRKMKQKEWKVVGATDRITNDTTILTIILVYFYRFSICMRVTIIDTE